jgi:hypothetical protein
MNREQKNLTIEGEFLKQYSLSYWGSFLGSYDTAKEALEEYVRHNKDTRHILDPKQKGRYSIRDWKKEITIADLRRAAKNDG